MSDVLIQSLVNTLSPKKILQNRVLWATGMLGFFACTALLISILGMRGDIRASIHSGALFWKPAIFLLNGGGGLWLLTSVSRPINTVRWWQFLPILSGVLLLSWQLWAQPTLSWQQLATPIAFYCTGCVLLAGFGLLWVLWHYWLRHTAPTNLAVSGLLAGFSASSLASAGYALHCNQDAAIFVLVYYHFSIGIVSLAGFLLARKALRW